MKDLSSHLRKFIEENWRDLLTKSTRLCNPRAPSKMRSLDWSVQAKRSLTGDTSKLPRRFWRSAVFWRWPILFFDGIVISFYFIWIQLFTKHGPVIWYNNLGRMSGYPAGLRSVMKAVPSLVLLTFTGSLMGWAMFSIIAHPQDHVPRYYFRTPRFERSIRYRDDRLRQSFRENIFKNPNDRHAPLWSIWNRHV